MQAYLKRQEKSQINHLTLHLKEIEQTKPKPSKRKEIIKIRAEIKDMETKKTTEQLNETRNWFFGNMNKIIIL